MLMLVLRWRCVLHDGWDGNEVKCTSEGGLYMSQVVKTYLRFPAPASACSWLITVSGWSWACQNCVSGELCYLCLPYCYMCDPLWLKVGLGWTSIIHPCESSMFENCHKDKSVFTYASHIFALLDSCLWQMAILVEMLGSGFIAVQDASRTTKSQ